MTPEPDRDGIVCLGEVLVDLVAADAGATVEGSTTFRRAPGGAPANVAVGLARLGRRAAFMGKVADDAFGRFLRATLEAEGLDTSGLVSDPAVRTALAFVGAGNSTERSFVFYHRGMADTMLRTDELDRTLIARARLFHFGSVTLVAEPSRTATTEAARMARGGGSLVSFDPNIRLELWDRPEDARAAIWVALPLAHLVKVSLDEVRWLSGTDDLEAGARRVRGRGPKLVVVTLGAEGAYFQTGAADGHVAGFPVAAVDATGAGDAFVAALLAGLDAAPDPKAVLDDPVALQAAVELANAAGAIATTEYGAIPSLPRYEAVYALVREAAGAPSGIRGGSDIATHTAPNTFEASGRLARSRSER